MIEYYQGVADMLVFMWFLLVIFIGILEWKELGKKELLEANK